MKGIPWENMQIFFGGVDMGRPWEHKTKTSYARVVTGKNTVQ